jgi:hypothetical protein
MGQAMPVLLYITYASYLSLGVNQVIIKNYSKLESEGKTYAFIKFNLQYLIGISVITFCLSYLFLDAKYAKYAALISIGSLFRTFFMSYFRVVFRISILNKNNLIFSFLFLLFTFFFVESLHEYLFYWGCALFASLILYFFDARVYFLSIFKNIFILPEREQLIYNLKEGIKLALTGLITTLLLTSDRFIVNKLPMNLEIKGSYQLADYAGTAYYLFFTTVIFYYYPKLITKLRSDVNFRVIYLKYMKIACLCVPVILFVIYLIAKIVSNVLFPEYLNLDLFIALSILIKSGVILINCFSTYYIALDAEKKYIISILPLIGAYVLVGVGFIFIYQPDTIYIPITLGLLLIIDFLHKLYTFESSKKAYSGF